LKELSLHILDLVENSISAKASLIKIAIIEELEKNLLQITIGDNGRGMDEELLIVVDNPFTTTRTTRSVGLGLSLFKSAALRANGDFHIISEKGKGTEVVASFKHDNIDRAPIGNMGSTISAILSREEKIDILYLHKINNKKFIFCTKEIKKLLGQISMNTPKVILWVQDYINENIEELNK